MDITQIILDEMIEQMVAHELNQATCICEAKRHSRCRDAGKLIPKE